MTRKNPELIDFEKNIKDVSYTRLSFRLFYGQSW